MKLLYVVFKLIKVSLSYDVVDVDNNDNYNNDDGCDHDDENENCKDDEDEVDDDNDCRKLFQQFIIYKLN